MVEEILELSDEIREPKELKSLSERGRAIDEVTIRSFLEVLVFDHRLGSGKSSKVLSDDEKGVDDLVALLPEENVGLMGRLELRGEGDLGGLESGENSFVDVSEVGLGDGELLEGVDSLGDEGLAAAKSVEFV